MAVNVKRRVIIGFGGVFVYCGKHKRMKNVDDAFWHAKRVNKQLGGTSLVTLKPIAFLLFCFYLNKLIVYFFERVSFIGQLFASIFRGQYRAQTYKHLQTIVITSLV